MYFYYQKTFSGEWIPKSSLDKPTPKTAEGNQKFPISQVVHLPSYQTNMTLAELTQAYPFRE